MFDRLRSWLARRIAPKPLPAAEPPRTRRKGLQPFPPRLRGPEKYERPGGKPDPTDALRQALQGDGGFGWTSDHREESEQLLGWVAVAIGTLAKAAAQSKCVVDRQIPPDGINDGGQEYDARPVQWNHPLARLFRRPNPSYDWSGLIKRIVIQRALTGTAIIWAVPSKEDGGDGPPCELYVIPTALVLPAPPSPQLPRGGYRVSASALTALFGGMYSGLNAVAGTMHTLDARHVVRLSTVHPLTEGDGLSPLFANRQQIDVAVETEQLIWSVLQNGAFPAAIASLDPSTAAGADQVNAMLEVIKEWIEAEYSGPDKAGKILPAYGMTLQKLGLSLTEAVTPEMRTQNRDFVMATYGVPAVAAGYQEGGSYSANHASRQQFTDGAVQPELSEIAGLLTVRLAARFGDDLEVRIEAKPPNDFEFELRKTESKSGSGAYTVDEIRAMHGDGPHPDSVVGKLPPAAVLDYAKSKFAQPQSPGGGVGGPGDPQPGGATDRAGAVGGPDIPPSDAGQSDDSQGGVKPVGPNLPEPMRRNLPTHDLNELLAHRAKGLAADVLPLPAIPPFGTNGTHKNGTHKKGAK